MGLADGSLPLQPGDEVICSSIVDEEDDEYSAVGVILWCSNIPSFEARVIHRIQSLYTPAQCTFSCH